ncbi:MAG: hypothetical protein OXG98_18800 [Gemmatimonadetes bacterium]|nr:hypothetical protein [Gemmatimonadota bacterium]
MIRRFTILILFLALSSPSTAVGATAGLCMTERSVSPNGMPAEGAHACCATAEAPETCEAGMLAMSCCSLEPAPYQETGAGALPAYSLVQPDQPDLSTPLRGPHAAEPEVHVSRVSPEMDTTRSPPPLRTLFCTYLI